MRISDWRSDVCSSDLTSGSRRRGAAGCAGLPATACGCRTAAAASHTAAGCGARARRRRRRGCRAAGPAAGRSPGGGDPGVGILAARYSFAYSRIMETEQAIAALTALGHATRLAAFRLLVEAGPDGRLAGSVADAIAVPGATLSFHLNDLVPAGLVSGPHRGPTRPQPPPL